MQTTFRQDAAGTLRLDDSLDFSGVVSGFEDNDHIDLSDIAFGAGVESTDSAATPHVI
jgi:hypothetical protein